MNNEATIQITKLIEARDSHELFSKESEAIQAKIDKLMEQIETAEEEVDHEMNQFMASLYA